MAYAPDGAHPRSLRSLPPSLVKGTIYFDAALILTRQESRLPSPFLGRGNEGDASEARVAYAPDGAHPPLTAFAAPFAREGGYLL